MEAVFDKDIYLENERVILRTLLAEDFEHLIYFSEREPELWNYSLMSGAGADNLKKYIMVAMQQKENLSCYPFIVYDKKLQSYAGSTRFYDLNSLQKNMLLGYTWYGKKFQGTGLNKNCKYLLLQYAFEKMNMERIEFRADNANEKSKAAMRSIGATQEGVLRNDSYNTNGGRRNSVILSILKTEWFESVKQKLADDIKKIS